MIGIFYQYKYLDWLIIASKINSCKNMACLSKEVHMHLIWKNKDFAEDIKFILFCQTDNTPDWWRKRLFQAYPSLDYDYTKSLSEHE